MIGTKDLLSILVLLLVGPSHRLVNASWIDPDTPMDKRTTQPFTVVPAFVPKEHSKKNSTKAKKTPFPTENPTTAPSSYPTSIPDTYHLVFSDEFDVPGRTFEDGTDPRWTALEKNDYTNDALHYYSPSNAATDENGNLVITTEATDTEVIGYDDVKRKKTKVTKHFRSAMLQSWNKFCFTGGIAEAEVQLPGKHNVGGLWPAFWILGNLARHTYVGSSNHIWPWSSADCTERSFHAQDISGCSKVAHYGLHAGVGRGAPEIDIFEVQPGNIKANEGIFLESPVGQPFMSASFQVAPGRTNRPGNGYWPGPGQWYDGLQHGDNTSINIGFYGSYNYFPRDASPQNSYYWSDAISFNRQLDESHFNSTHVYRVEWDVPTDEKDGYLHWFLDGKLILAINGTGVKASGTGSEVSTEPSYILLNTAVSSQWGFPKPCPANCECKEFDCNAGERSQHCGFSEGFCDMVKEKDPLYKINYVRVYQNPNMEEQKVGCSTPERPTRQFIEAHKKSYMTEYDEEPLKPLQRGRGKCNPRADGIGRSACGGPERGSCTQGSVCECKEGWAGPHCLTSDGRDDIFWDEPDRITDVGFVPPRILPSGLLVGLGVLGLAFIGMVHWHTRRRDWTPIPDVDDKYMG